MMESTLASAILLGLMGASHCLAMCGGIISSLSIVTREQSRRWPLVVSYQLGRISCYTLFGLAFGWLGFHTNQLSPLPVLQVLSGVLLILMGLYISRLWMAISYLERAGKLVWNKISPLSKPLLPVTNSRQAILLGALWGWLPCGLVYTALGYALTTASPVNSALFMLFFGLGTLPATLLAGAASLRLKSWLNHPVVRNISALLFIGLGVYSLLSLLLTGETHHHH
jgi:uncharacterized protein